MASYTCDSRVLHKLESQLVREYFKRTPKSREHFQEALRFLPAGVTYKIRDMYPYPVIIARSIDSVTLKDIDGNTYIDFWMGHGALVLGHNPPKLADTLRAQAEAGTHYGFEHPLAYKWANLISSGIKAAEQMRFTNSGTEANMYAIRLSRAFTGRSAIVKVKGGWHGSYNGLHSYVHPPYKPLETSGVPDELASHVYGVDISDVEGLKDVIRGQKPAGVIIEPVLGAGGAIEVPVEFIKTARDECDAVNCLLISDEVITGFRSVYGSYMERHHNVEPDIVVLGKAVGGGLPVGVVAGRREIMKLIDHRVPGDRKVFHGGTFSGNPMTAAAGVTVLSFLKDNSWVYEKMAELLYTTRREARRLALKYGLPIHVSGAPGVIGIHLTEAMPENALQVFQLRYCPELYRLIHLNARLNSVLYISESVIHLLPSGYHEDTHIRHFMENVVAPVLEVAVSS